jgi:hypothetical protein
MQPSPRRRGGMDPRRADVMCLHDGHMSVRTNCRMGIMEGR